MEVVVYRYLVTERTWMRNEQFTHADLCTRINDQNVTMVGIVKKGGLFETKKCADQFRGCTTIEPLDGLVVEWTLLTFGVEIEKRDRFDAV